MTFENLCQCSFQYCEHEIVAYTCILYTFLQIEATCSSSYVRNIFPSSDIIFLNICFPLCFIDSISNFPVGSCSFLKKVLDEERGYGDTEWFYKGKCCHLLFSKYLMLKTGRRWHLIFCYPFLRSTEEKVGFFWDLKYMFRNWNDDIALA